MRAIRSALPPGGKLTMKRIGFDGQACACTGRARRQHQKTGTEQFSENRDIPCFSLPLDAARLHDALPARDFLLDAASPSARARKAPARRRSRRSARASRPARGSRAVRCSGDRRRARRAGRDGEAEPGAELDALQRLADRRHVGHQRIAAGGGERERAQAFRLDRAGTRRSRSRSARRCARRGAR